MKRSVWRNNYFVVFMLSCFFMLGSSMASQAVADVVKMKLSSIFPSSTSTWPALQKFAAQVKEQTNGEVEIQLYPPGAIAAPMQQFDLLKKGAIQLAFSAGPMHARKVPEGLIELGLPYAWKGKRGTTEAYDKLYEFIYDWRDGIITRIFEESYAKHGVAWIGCGPGSDYGFMTKFPVKSLDDFKNKKLRSMGLYNTIVQKLGASSVTISNTELYLSLQRGVIDGMIYSIYDMEGQNLKEVVGYVLWPSLEACPNLDLLANAKAFNALPAQHQKTIKKIARQEMTRYSHGQVALLKDAIDKAKEAGVKEIFLSAADDQKMQEIARSTWEIAASKSENSRKIRDLLIEFLKEKGDW